MCLQYKKVKTVSGWNGLFAGQICHFLRIIKRKPWRRCLPVDSCTFPTVPVPPALALLRCIGEMQIWNKHMPNVCNIYCIYFSVSYYMLSLDYSHAIMLLVLTITVFDVFLFTISKQQSFHSFFFLVCIKYYFEVYTWPG